MQTSSWQQQDGELTQTVPWFSSNESALRATIADLMQSPGVRSVSFQEPRRQLLIRFDRTVTSAGEIRAASLHPVRVDHTMGDDAVRWAPIACSALLKLATALAG
ncbi:MAG: hypothetical protein ABW321_19110 [Polyangiales bacterium]